MRWPLILAPLIIAPLIVAAAPSEVLTIGDKRFPQAEILDARAVGSATGAAVLVTLNPVAAEKLGAVTRANVGKTLTIRLGVAVLSSPIVHEPILGGSFELTGNLASFAEAEALALRISGKPPLPETFDE